MTLALWYMSVLWHMSFMLWYCDTPVVLWYDTGVMVHVSVVASVIYVKVMWHTIGIKMSLVLWHMSVLWHIIYSMVLWHTIGVKMCHWCYGMSVLWHMSFMLWYCGTPLVLWYDIDVMVYVSVVAYAMYVMVLWHATGVMECHWSYGIRQCCGICHLFYGTSVSVGPGVA
jgi:hypothetical protein